MQAHVDWVLRIFGTQVTKAKRPVQPVFPDYLSVSYDYDLIHLTTYWRIESNLVVSVSEKL